jgi:hypothetical protein
LTKGKIVIRYWFYDCGLRNEKDKKASCQFPVAGGQSIEGGQAIVLKYFGKMTGR